MGSLHQRVPKKKVPKRKASRFQMTPSLFKVTQQQIVITYMVLGGWRFQRRILSYSLGVALVNNSKSIESLARERPAEQEGSL